MKSLKRMLVIMLVSVATVSIAQSSGQAQTCLVGHWQFKEGMGDFIADSSGSGNPGTRGALPSGPTWISGRFGSALQFDGNDFVRISNSPTLAPATVTVAAWVRHLGYPGRPDQPVSYIVAKGGAFGCSAAAYALYSRGGLSFYISTASHYVLSPDAGPVIWDGQWHYVVGSYDRSAVRLFVDGSEVGLGTPATDPIVYNTLPPHELFIGSYGDPTLWACAYPFIGDIDEVSVWGCDLSPCEIAAAYRHATALVK